jgi:hypothetical protein
MIRRLHDTARLARIATAAVLLIACAAAGGAQPDQAALEKQLADAQSRLDAAARDVAELSGQLYGDQKVEIVKMVHGGSRGAMLGVNIGGPGQRDDGVEVMGVSPDGPAEAAGLKAGDVIVAVDGEGLARTGERSPASLLVAHMRAVEPGQVVKVQYLRDGKRATAEVKTVAADPMMVKMMRGHGMPLDMQEDPPMPGMHRMLLRGPGFGALELVPVTPGLGRYFGTDKGLLVVRAPSQPGLGLTDGDVLLTIGGRVPENPGQAFRILQSYEPGDKVKLGILRDRKRMDVEATLPAGRGMREHEHPGAAPPPPPAPAKPAAPGKADSA